MGCSSSSSLEARTLAFVRQRFPRLLSFLELSGHAHEIARFFGSRGTLKEGESKLFIDEFIDMLRLNRTRAAVRLFSVCDFEGTGALDFRELLFTLWHLCTLDDLGLCSCLFDLYDGDADGVIMIEEVQELVSDCYGAGLAENPEVQLVLADLAKGGPLRKQGFWDFTRRSPQTLKQIVDMQTRSREAVLGVSVWQALERRRGKKVERDHDEDFLPHNWQVLYAKLCALDLEAGGVGKDYKVVVVADDEEEEEEAPVKRERLPAPSGDFVGDITIARGVSQMPVQRRIKAAEDSSTKPPPKASKAAAARREAKERAKIAPAPELPTPEPAVSSASAEATNDEPMVEYAPKPPSSPPPPLATSSSKSLPAPVLPPPHIQVQALRRLSPSTPSMSPHDRPQALRRNSPSAPSMSQPDAPVVHTPLTTGAKSGRRMRGSGVAILNAL